MAVFKSEVTPDSEPGSGVAQSSSMSQDSRAEDWKTAEEDVMKYRAEKRSCYIWTLLLHHHPSPSFRTPKHLFYSS